MKDEYKIEAMRWLIQAEEKLKDAKYLLEAKRYDL